MNNNINLAIKILTEHAREIVSGSYKNVERIFSLTDPNTNSPEIAELAEAFGMMTVKVEAREYSLERRIEELEEKNAQIEKLNNIRTQLSSIFISVVMLVTFYIFVLGFLNDDFISRQAYAGKIKEYSSRGIELLSLIIVIRMIIKSRLPLKDFGITLSGWKRSIVESLGISAIIIALLCAAKFIINIYSPGVFKETSMFDLKYIDLSYVTYIVIAPLQEFITRGTVQGILQKLFTSKLRGFLAIMVTTLLFGALHMVVSINLAIVAMLTGWLWGWMFWRQKNLIGVSLSHFLIGNISGLLGYWIFL
jgi:membrane protease YdiL (CAAX protease family)